MIRDAFHRIQVDRPVECFQNGGELIRFLKNTTAPPFLIISDVNMPVDNGFAVKKKITDDQDLEWKSVPYVYLTTSESEAYIKKSYELQAQGYFAKPNDFGKLCARLKTIVEYWGENAHPKTVI